MLKKNIRMMCASLLSAGAVLFAGNAYANGGVVSQVQYDAPATAGTASAAANGSANNAAAANEPAGPSAQLSATGTGAAKQVPASTNGSAVVVDVFPNETSASK